MCQAKKDAEEKAARELNELFAETIKQPKAPPGLSLLTLRRHPICTVALHVKRQFVLVHCLYYGRKISASPRHVCTKLALLIVSHFGYVTVNSTIKHGAPGVDPKSIVCEHFRAGKCAKGFKCKYSHDLDVERKKAKIDLFSDQ